MRGWLCRLCGRGSRCVLWARRHAAHSASPLTPNAVDTPEVDKQSKLTETEETDARKEEALAECFESNDASTQRTSSSPAGHRVPARESQLSSCVTSPAMAVHATLQSAALRCRCSRPAPRAPARVRPVPPRRARVSTCIVATLCVTHGSWLLSCARRSVAAPRHARLSLPRARVVLAAGDEQVSASRTRRDKGA